jgi:hypothetical protein
MANGKAFCNLPIPMHGCAAISWRAVRQKLKKGWLCLCGNGRTSNFHWLKTFQNRFIGFIPLVRFLYPPSNPDWFQVGKYNLL